MTNDTERWLYDELKKEGAARIADLTSNEDVLAIRNARLGGNNPFPKWNPAHPERYSRPITIFDTETGHNDEIIAIGAIKVALNNLTHQFETVDTYERYYMPTETRSKSWREHLAVHQLTPSVLKKLRKAQKKQGLAYGEHYSASEQVAFRKFFEGSILSGHNIEKADIPWALGDQLSDTSVIDTLVALENMRGRGGNKLNQVFKDITGKTMEEAGFSHHNAMSDVFATSVVLNALLNTRGDTGQALRFVLQHPGTHLAPINEYEALGPTQVTYGPYKGYMRDVGYYIDRGRLRMRPTDKRYDIGDPSNPGHFAEGWGYDLGNVDDQAGDVADEYIRSVTSRRSVNIDRAVDNSKITQQFISLANSVRAVQQSLTQSLKDFTGALRVNTQSSRPSMIRFLANFATTDAGYEQNQKWKDAAQALGLESTSWSSLYKSSRDYAEKKGMLSTAAPDWDLIARDLSAEYTYSDDTAKRLRSAARAEEAYKKHRITKGQYESIIATYDGMDDALDTAIEKTDLWTSSLKALSQVPVFNPDRFFSAFESGMGHTLGSAKGVVPSSLLRPAGRYADLMMQSNRYHYAPFKAADNIINAVGPAATTIAYGINPIAGAVVGGVTGAAKLATQVAGNVGEAKIQRTFNRMSMGLDILGLNIDMLTLPFTMLAKATKNLLKGFLGLGNFLKGFTTNQLNAMGQLGTPLTNLTGVGYPEYQGLGIAEHMIGLGAGTLNSVVEDFSRQKQLFYTTGSVDTNRLVAASMLGVFNDVYGAGSYGSMINKLASRTMTSSDMALLSRIDPHSAQVVQVMQDLGVTDINKLKDPSFRGIYFNPLSDATRQRMRVANYEYSSVQESFGNSFKRIGLRIWEGGGKTIANTFNKFLASIAEGGDWKSSLSKLRSDVAGVFSKLFDAGDKDWVSTIKTKIGELWDKVLPVLKPVVNGFIDLWVDGIKRLYDSLKPYLNTFLNLISGIKITGDPFKGYRVELPEFMREMKYSAGDSAGRKFTRQELRQFVESTGPNYNWKQHGLKIGGHTFHSKEEALDFIEHGEGWTDYMPLLNSLDHVLESGRKITKYGMEQIPGLTEAVAAGVAQTAVDVKNMLEITFTDASGKRITVKPDSNGNFNIGDAIKGAYKTMSNGGR